MLILISAKGLRVILKSRIGQALIKPKVLL